MIEGRSVVASEWKAERDGRERSQRDMRKIWGVTDVLTYLGHSDGFTSVYICQNLSNRML